MIKKLLSLCLVFALACSLIFTVNVFAADYTNGVSVAGTTATIWFKSNVSTTWVDVHYTINSGAQQNFRMTYNSGNARYEQNVTVATGNVISYSFTYNNGAPAYDTPWFNYTVGSSSTPTPTPTPGGATPTPTPSGATPTPTPTSGGRTLVWSDEFNGSGTPDSANWNCHIGNGFNPGAGAFDGWGNGEWEWYQPANAYQSGGNLVIRADYNTTPLNIAGRQWYQTSARITTQGKKSWKYGLIEARMKLPTATATWPAFWMMGTSCDATYKSITSPNTSYDTMATNWASCGEIDIMEHKNGDTTYTNNLFWDTRTGIYPWSGTTIGNAPSTINCGDVSQFHLYSLEWTSTQLKWYFDRDINPNPVKVIDITPGTMEEFQQQFFIILNLAISGTYTGPATPVQSQFPVYMYVDYVRVYQ